MAQHLAAMNHEAAARTVRLLDIAAHRLDDGAGTGCRRHPGAGRPALVAGQLVQDFGAMTTSDEDLAGAVAIWAGKSLG